MNLADVRSRLNDNLAAVEARIAAACARSHRRRDDVTLIAVTKYVEPEVAALLLDLGVRDLGESRPQELWRKAAALPNEVRWHLVGHLQRNKVARTLKLAYLVHSVDSFSILEAIDREASKLDLIARILFEIKLSDDVEKHGFDRSFVESFDREFKDEYFENTDFLGLMTMPSLSDDPETARPAFAELRRHAKRLGRAFQQHRGMVQWSNVVKEQGSRIELSMGMSNDFEVAIEEGATMVRIGSALFEGIVA